MSRRRFVSRHLLHSLAGPKRKLTGADPLKSWLPHFGPWSWPQKVHLVFLGPQGATKPMYSSNKAFELVPYLRKPHVTRFRWRTSRCTRTLPVRLIPCNRKSLALVVLVALFFASCQPSEAIPNPGKHCLLTLMQINMKPPNPSFAEEALFWDSDPPVRFLPLICRGVTPEARSLWLPRPGIQRTGRPHHWHSAGGLAQNCLGYCGMQASVMPKGRLVIHFARSPLVLATLNWWFGFGFEPLVLVEGEWETTNQTKPPISGKLT